MLLLYVASFLVNIYWASHRLGKTYILLIIIEPYTPVQFIAHTLYLSKAITQPQNHIQAPIKPNIINKPRSWGGGVVIGTLKLANKPFLYLLFCFISFLK